jgi:lambda repressor-like predicted transcriptional regulator
VNTLPSWKRALVLEMRSRGATIREIGDAVGCHRSTVSMCIERVVKDRRKIVAKVEALEDSLRALGIDAWGIEGFLDLIGHLNFSCPIHPENETFDNLDGFSEDGEGCMKCIASVADKKSAGLKRHHERRKEEGRPIVPPWCTPKPKLPPILG